MAKLYFIFTACLLLIVSGATAQWKQTYLDANQNTTITGISFFNASEGYAAFNNYVGYTTDSGKTFIRRNINSFAGNVNFNGYSGVNLTLGFTINKIYAKSRSEFFLYGNYTFNPAILYSQDSGATFKLVYHYNLYAATQELSDGFIDAKFPTNGLTGYAIEEHQLVKTTNGGQSWSVLKYDNTQTYRQLFFSDNANGYLVTDKELLGTSNGGATFQRLSLPVDNIKSAYFLTAAKGWIMGSKNGGANQLYYTNTGGTTWNVQSTLSGVSGTAINFVSDTVGYMLSSQYDILKTTDGGMFWEHTARDNNYTYNYFNHGRLFFLNEQVGWAGGGHGFLERTSNGGNPLKPIAAFTTDTSLISSSVIKFFNKSKPGRTYAWYRNSVPFSTAYDATYTTNRKTIDSFKLVVRNGIYADSASIIIDTRKSSVFCEAFFDAKVDTSTVQFISAKNDDGVVHQWEFGDGAIDTSINPVHKYAAAGIYKVLHKVFNPVDKCMDNAVTLVEIIRIQNCLKPNFTYTADSFFENRIIFQVTFDTTEINMGVANPGTSPWTVNYGDGQTGNTMPPHSYDSAKQYNVCLSVKHAATGCRSTICNPVTVKASTECSADFVIKNNGDGVFEFTGKPYVGSDSVTNLWIFYGRDTINTGKGNYLRKDFFTNYIFGGGQSWSTSSAPCNASTREICIDSLKPSVVHVLVNKSLNCSVSKAAAITIPVKKDLTFTVRRNATFPQLYEFQVDEAFGNIQFPYYSGYRMNRNEWGGISGTLSYLFEKKGMHLFAVKAPCTSYNPVEVYYRVINVDTINPCPFVPSLIQSTVSKTNPLSYTFTDTAMNMHNRLHNSWRWYFGDGDSSSNATHTYKTPGNYTVQIVYFSLYGCRSSTTSMSINVKDPACSVKPLFLVNRDSLQTNRVYLLNYSSPDTVGTVYTWYFGNGDSSTQKNPVYTYAQGGQYVIKLKVSKSASCFAFADTTINITIACTVQPFFTNTAKGKQVLFKNESPDIIKNDPGAKLVWSFGDGATATLKDTLSHTYSSGGQYLVGLKATLSSGCESTYQKYILINECDSSFAASFQAIPGQDPFIISFNNTSTDTAKAQFKWTFGNGDSSALISPVYTYKSTGTYKVVLKATKDGCVRIYEANVIISSPACNLTSNFDYSISAGNLLQVNFTNKSTTGTGVSYLWSFGDGSTSALLHPVHTFTNPGSYKFELTVTQGSCVSKSIKNNILIGSATATCNLKGAFNAYIDTLTLKAHFINNTSPGTDISYRWEFGDGATDTLKNPVHTYQKSGTYTVKLYSKKGTCMDTFALTIQVPVICKLQADFSYILDPTELNLVRFSAGGDTSGLQMQWNFGDNVVSNDRQPSHKYALPGTYDVCLMIYKNITCWRWICKKVILMPKPGIVYIAPNPAASSITAIFRQPFSLDCSIRIIDQAGMVVKTVSNKYPAGSNREEIDVSGLQKGLYMLQVANANGIIAFGKFIKL